MDSAPAVGGCPCNMHLLRYAYMLFNYAQYFSQCCKQHVESRDEFVMNSSVITYRMIILDILEGVHGIIRVCKHRSIRMHVYITSIYAEPVSRYRGL